MLFSENLSLALRFRALLLATIFSIAAEGRGQSAPSFISQPGNISISDGGDFRISAQVATSNFATVTWRLIFPSRTVSSTATSSSQLNNFVSATVSFGPMSLSDSGSFRVEASNIYGSTLSAVWTLSVFPTVPEFSSFAPASQTVLTGATVRLSATATGTAPIAYQWRKNDVNIPGATSTSYTITNAKVSDSGNYVLLATNSVASVPSRVAIVTVNAIVAPVITTQPVSKTVDVGVNTNFTVTATGTPPLSYQWRRNGVAVSGNSIGGAGGTEPTLNITPKASDAGGYSVVVSNVAGSVTSDVASLSINLPTRLSNIAILASLSTTAPSLTLGTVIGGAGTTGGAKSVISRAAGPALAELSVPGFLPDPMLQIYKSNTLISTNDNWGAIAPPLTTAMSKVGAFPFPNGSKDAAASISATGFFTAVIIASNGSAASPTKTGVVLAELYDATDPDVFSFTTPRLINASVLMALNIGGSLTAGFTIAGQKSMQVLIRAVGPGLSGFGIANYLRDPTLKLFNAAGQMLQLNSGWANDEGLRSAMTKVGAFPVQNGSADAMLLATLAPGGYTASAQSLSGVAEGLMIIEIYEVP